MCKIIAKVSGIKNLAEISVWIFEMRWLGSFSFKSKLAQLKVIDFKIHLQFGSCVIEEYLKKPLISDYNSNSLINNSWEKCVITFVIIIY